VPRPPPAEADRRAGRNQDGSINGLSTPTSHGDYIPIYSTGFGSYAVLDASGLLQMLPPVAVIFGDHAGLVQFAGQAPGYTAGLQQINVQIWASALTGAVPIRLTVGNAAMQ
jgi:uncharacterized protein (TIGR03437 family)